MAYCSRCQRFFNNYPALYQHEKNSPHHNICGDCDMDFTSWTGLKEHYVQSRAHDYCQRCDQHFDNPSGLEYHYQQEHHYCAKCRRFFQNERGLSEHYRQSDLHHYCAPCKRLFQSASNLQSHLNSSIHRPKEVICPGRGCGLGFVTRSALLLHLEAGTCSSGSNRQTVNRIVRQYDTNNVITNTARLLTGGDNQVNYMASAASWNGSAYECYLCHGGYRSLAALNHHLASPTRHQSFTTLSALCQHIESERCGVFKFKAVQNAMNDLMGGMRRLTAS
ncbi:hypothetical protein C8R43DRAFT_1193400 [Mycena crocata]|nr:hypothetical protein C8R43DRAFT_1193400 [Mycena crocata]